MTGVVFRVVLADLERALAWAGNDDAAIFHVGVSHEGDDMLVSPAEVCSTDYRTLLVCLSRHGRMAGRAGRVGPGSGTGGG